jgi:hypothetical protein
LGRGEIADDNMPSICAERGGITDTPEGAALMCGRPPPGRQRSCSDELAAETTVLNRSCAVRRARFARLRADVIVDSGRLGLGRRRPPVTIGFIEQRPSNAAAGPAGSRSLPVYLRVVGAGDRL